MSGSDSLRGGLEELETRTRALLASDRLSVPTRRTLQARLAQTFGAPRVLSASQMRTLQAVCLRLIPEPELVSRVALAAALDAQLAERKPRGWRHADAPDDRRLISDGLDALDAPCPAFADAPDEEQDRRLREAQACRGSFAHPPMARWFEETLSALVELYCAHPLVQVAIAYDGMADVGDLAVGFEAVAAEDPPLAR